MSAVDAAPLLAACRLDVAIGGRTVVRELDMKVDGGEIVAVLGRNGSGKTTLLHTLAGVRAPADGRVEMCGTSCADRDGRDMARLRGLLAQNQSDPFPASVLETALIGRHPHLGRWAWETAGDEEIARAALAAVGLSGLERREVHTLSGGERQRLGIATLLAQQPLLHLLDEPLAHLDLNHQIEILELVRHTARERGAAFIIVLHDVNLALRYCHRALLLFGDGRWREGSVDATLTAPILSDVYAHPLREIGDGSARYFVAV